MQLFISENITTPNVNQGLGFRLNVVLIVRFSDYDLKQLLLCQGVAARSSVLPHHRHCWLGIDLFLFSFFVLFAVSARRRDLFVVWITNLADIVIVVVDCAHDYKVLCDCAR